MRGIFILILCTGLTIVCMAQMQYPGGVAPSANAGQIDPYVKFAYEDIRVNKRYQMPSAYSATLILRKDGQMEVQKISVDGPRWRADQILENGDVLTIVMRDDLQSGFATKTGVKGFTRIDYSDHATKNPVVRLILPLYAENKFRTNDSEVEFIGDIVCQKLNLDTRAGKAVLWVDRSRWTPVRLASGDGSMVVDFKDFKLGRPEPALFEIPVEKPEKDKQKRM